MNLLLDREQNDAAVFTLVPLKIGGGTTFTLHAEIELNEKESKLLRKYNMHKSLLSYSFWFDDLKMAFWPALLVAIVALIILSMLVHFQIAISLSILTLLVMTGVYFKTLREQIMVSDFLNGGRKFRCDSIEDLVKKEASIEGKSQYLRQVLVTAEHWGDRESIEIKPMSKEDAKRLLQL